MANNGDDADSTEMTDMAVQPTPQAAEPSLSADVLNESQSTGPSTIDAPPFWTLSSPVLFSFIWHRIWSRTRRLVCRHPWELICTTLLALLLDSFFGILGVVPAWQSKYIAQQTLDLDRWEKLKEFWEQCRERAVCLSLAKHNHQC